MTTTSTLRLCSALFCLLLASGCTVLTEGDDSVTVRVTVEDVNTRAPLPDARVGIGYSRLGLSTTWIETAQTDANGQYTFELMECERTSVVVNAFGASAPGGGSYGPSQEAIACAPGDYTVTLRLAQF